MLKMGEIQRLDKMIGNSGLGTRKEVKELIKRGAVSVNGAIVDQPEFKVDPYSDTVKINGSKLKYRKFIYLMMNKQAGVITATEDKREKTVFDVLPDFYKRFDLSPAGRLDKDTEGLLVLTNDGESIHELLSPKKHVDKKYFAILEKPVEKEYFSKIKQGIDIGGYVTMPAVLEIAGTECEVFLTIREGKFHQVKRMFEALGNKVAYLKRISMGNLYLDEKLSPGEVRELTEKEIKLLLGEKYE